jgi:hypothetical protein
MKNKVPDVKLDSDGYPTEEFLEFIKNYIPDSSFPISKFIELLKEVWWISDSLIEVIVDSEQNIELILHTGGWSGNKSIISAILDNMYLTHGAMRYYQWNVGGHYRFKVKDDDYLTN